MPFRIKIKEVIVDAAGVELAVIERYEQTVEQLDLRAVMDAVNRIPRKRRKKEDDKP